MQTNPYAELSDDQVRLNLDVLAKRESEAGVEIILHLMVVKERKLHIPMGYDGLFAYCVGRLGFAKSTAFRRKVVVDTAEKFPKLLDAMRGGLHLCVAAAVAPFLTEANAEELISQVRGLSHRDVTNLLFKRSLRPQPETPVVAHSNVGTPTNSGNPQQLSRDPKNEDLHSQQSSPLQTSEPLGMPRPAAPTPRAPLPRTIVKALTADASRVNFSLKDTTVGKLRRAKELLPRKTDDEILDCALDFLLTRFDPARRHAQREQRAQRQAKRKAKIVAFATEVASRRGKLAERDAAYVESGGRCTFVSADGVRCGAKAYLEVDHVRPWALGGKSNKDNFRLLCSAHNKWQAAQSYGGAVDRRSAFFRPVS